MTLLEAMSIGKPCVVTDAGGNPEIVTHNINGLVTPNNNASAFASSIISLANDRSLISSMAEKSRQRFIEQFSAASMTSQFQRLYEQVITQ